MKAHILHTIGNHVYYTVKEDQTKAIYKMEISRNMLEAACETFIGGSVISASPEQQQDTVQFFHSMQGVAIKSIDLYQIARQLSEAIRPVRIRCIKQQFLNTNGYTFA